MLYVKKKAGKIDGPFAETTVHLPQTAGDTLH